jgi:hypothetical protein
MDMHLSCKECFICGEEITPGKRIRAHLIPKCLKPKHNVIVLLHGECEKKINSLYVSQQKKPYHAKAKKKVLNMLENLHTGIRVLEEKIEEEKED